MEGVKDNQDLSSGKFGPNPQSCHGNYPFVSPCARHCFRLSVGFLGLVVVLQAIA
jgi:hypothetical protein